MTRFDAGSPSVHPEDSSFTSARATVASHPGIFALSNLLAALAIAVACALLLVGQGARYQVARTIDGLQLSVFMQPQASRADAEGMRPRLEAIPTVVGARLRTREDALTALVGAGLPALVGKANPLPDVWLVSLASPVAGSPESPLAARIADARAALASLPGVESVRVDGRWVDLLDRSSAWVAHGMTVAIWTISTALLASLLGFFFLTGRALSAGGRLGYDRMQALATIGMVTGLLSLALAGGVLALVTTLTPSLSTVWKPILDSIGRNGHIFVVAIGLGVILISALGHALGGSRR